MAFGLRTSWVRAIDVTDLVHSFTEPSIIVCECASMIPGKTNLPVASITRAPVGALKFEPTAVIFPLRISTSVFCSVPRETVSTVAFFIRVVCAASRGWAPMLMHPKVTRQAIRNSLFISRTPRNEIFRRAILTDWNLQILPDKAICDKQIFG